MRKPWKVALFVLAVAAGVGMAGCMSTRLLPLG